MRDRIKFYSIHDLTFSKYFNQAIQLIDKYSSEMPAIEVNNAIEIFNAKKFIDTGVKLVAWSETDTHLYKNRIETLFTEVAKFFKNRLFRRNPNNFLKKKY